MSHKENPLNLCSRYNGVGDERDCEICNFSPPFQREEIKTERGLIAFQGSKASQWHTWSWFELRFPEPLSRALYSPNRSIIFHVKHLELYVFTVYLR